jgi:hypothetical protein
LGADADDGGEGCALSEPLLQRDPRADAILLLGEAITDDVEAWDIETETETLVFTWCGRTYRFKLESVEEGTP